MGRGIHSGRTQFRPYTNEFYRIPAKAFRSLLTSPLGDYKLNGLDLSEAHCNFKLRDSNRWELVMEFTFDGREVPIPLRQDTRSASNKLYLVCPYCSQSRQHLYAVTNTYACRLCAGLHYASQSERQPDRLARKIRKLRRSLWGNERENIDNLLDNSSWWPKPKRVRWSTFEKKKTEIAALETLNLRFMVAFVETHFHKTIKQ